MFQLVGFGGSGGCFAMRPVSASDFVHSTSLAARWLLIEDHLADDGRDREERERYQDIYNPDRDPIAALLALLAFPAPPDFVELVGHGHVPLPLPRFYFGVPSACASNRLMLSVRVGISGSSRSNP
jgi:hypothetical protein